MAEGFVVDTDNLAIYCDMTAEEEDEMWERISLDTRLFDALVRYYRYNDRHCVSDTFLVIAQDESRRYAISRR